MNILHFSYCCLLLCNTAVHAAESDWSNPINTDRPSFTNSTATVEKNGLQLETGVVRVSAQSIEGDHTWTTQTPWLLRYGLGERFEARLQSDGYSWVNAGGQRNEGWADLAVGFKSRHLDASGLRPAIGSIVMLTTPSGARAIGSVGVRPSYQLPFDFNFPEKVQLTLMPGAVYDRDANDQSFWSGQFSAVLSRPFTPRIDLFIEWADQQLTTPRHGGVIASANTGIQYLLTPCWQLDAASWWGVNRNTPNALWTLGLSYLYDPNFFLPNPRHA